MPILRLRSPHDSAAVRRSPSVTSSVYGHDNFVALESSAGSPEGNLPAGSTSFFRSVGNLKKGLGGDRSQTPLFRIQEDTQPAGTEDVENYRSRPFSHVNSAMVTGAGFLG
jgi:hypothetical protein